MQIKRPEIILSGIQLKSLSKCRVLAKALSIIEEECGIHECRITVRDIFVCPWIDIGKLNGTPMQKLLKSLILKTNCLHGKDTSPQE